MAKEKQPKSVGTESIKIKYESNGLNGTFGNELFDASRILQTTAYGVKIAYDSNFHGSNGGEIISANKSHSNSVGVVHVIQYIPSLGGFRGAQRMQNAMKDQFVAVVGDAYSKIDLNEVDLSKLQVYGESVVKLIIQIDRALEVYDYTNTRNLGCGPALVSACGFAWADIAMHRQSYIDARNALAKIVNEKLYVGNNQRLDKEMYLLSRVFVSDMDDKTEFAVYVPADYLDIDMTTGDLSVRTALWQDWDKAIKLITLDALNLIKTELDLFTISAWFNEVAPYLYHIYGDSRKNLISIGAFEGTKGSYVYTYNPVINQMIRNADYVDDLVDAESSTKTAIIYEDSQGRLIQGARGPQKIKVMELYPDYYESNSNWAKLEFDNKLLTLDQYPASTDEVVTAMLGKVILGNAIAGDEDITDESKYGIMWSGPILHMKNVAFTVNNVDSPTKILAASGVHLHRYLVNSGLFATRYTSVTSVNGYAGWLIGTARFRNGAFTPNIKFITFPASLASGTAQVVDLVHDLDNYVQVPMKNFEPFFYAYTYEAGKIIVPEFTARK